VNNKTLAAIDIGTNTLRLLIATVRFNPEKQSYSIKEIFSERIITRLGGGLSGNGLLKKKAMSKSLSALKRFSSVLSRYDVYKTRAVATSALREAGNSKEFLAEVKGATGLAVKIISGEEEARIAASGMLIDIAAPETALMVDIGGGSTELIFAKQGKPVLVKSLNLGVVYLAGRFMKHDPPFKEDLIGMDRYISEKIGPIVTPYSELKTQDPELKTVLIGTAGTVTTLSAVAKGLAKFEHNKIHKSRLTLDKVKKIYSDIAPVSSRERAGLVPFEPSRLDIIVPGTLILLKLMETFGFREIIVSNHGLREGILVELHKKIMK